MSKLRCYISVKSLWIKRMFSDNSRRDMISRKRTVFPVLLFLTLALIPTSAQSPTIFSPFPSSLRAKESGEGVRLTWRDSPDVFETYHIFRHTTEIDEASFTAAREVGTVPPGTATFTDYPTVQDEYYYAVLIEDPAGGLYELFIPFRNKTVVGIPVSGAATEAELAAEVLDLNAVTADDAVRLTFETDKTNRSLTIYRHTRPIGDVDALLEASRIGMIESDIQAFTDFPIPGIQYYYGIFDTKLMQTGTFHFAPGENITVVPVKIAAEAGRPGLKPVRLSYRTPPLPRIMLKRGIESGELLVESLALTSPDRRELSPQTARTIADLIDSLPPRDYPSLEPEILPQHVNGSLEGAAYTLALILKEQFTKGEYKAAADSLESFLSIRREEAVDIAARYYLGQAYYFEGEYQKAFFEFLRSEERFYPEAQAWIDDIYRRFREKEPEEN